ncbi:MAG: ribosomal protein S18-alanine N-acetyltransferase [Clostridia bacterium]
MTENDWLHFRFMTIEDVEAVAELEELSFPTPWPKDAFVNEMTINQHAKYMLAIAEDKIVAYCGVWIIIDEAHITNIAVHPDYRGRKIGEMLMRQVMGLAVLLGAERMTLEVRPSNQTARNLYDKLGFTAAGVRKGYYSDNNEDAIIMWVELNGKELE